MDEDTSPSLLGAAFVTGNSSDDGKAKSLWGIGGAMGESGFRRK